MTFDDLDFTQPSPPPRPNFTAPARDFHREQSRAGKSADDAAGERRILREWWNALPEGERETMRALFRETPQYAATAAVVDWQQKRGRDALVVIQWSKSESERVTR